MRNSKAKGFTLIELIVVMAIIGVLAAILVPSMIGYLNDSKFSKANANAKQVYQSAANWATKCETNSQPATASITYDGDLVNNETTVANSAIVFKGTDQADLKNALICYMGGQKNSGYAYVEVENSAAKFGQWAGSQADTTGTSAIFGEYPNETNANKVANGAATWGTQTTGGSGSGSGSST